MIKNCISFTLLLFCSCITVKGELKGLYSYFDKTDKLYPGLLVKPAKDEPVCSISKTETPKIIIANGEQIRSCMIQSNHALFYFWQPKCKGELCYAIEVVQLECNKKNIDLYIVAEYYDGEKMQQQYNINRPIFGIDTEYYHSSFCDTYVPKFIGDVTGNPVRNIRFVAFRNGSIERVFERLEEL